VGHLGNLPTRASQKDDGRYLMLDTPGKEKLMPHPSPSGQSLRPEKISADVRLSPTSFEGENPGYMGAGADWPRVA
jgi:hypothetical protein